MEAGSVTGVDTAALGGRRCQTCGRVHDALWWKPGDPSAGYSWAAPDDRHPYKPEAWERVAARYGWSPEAERERFGVAGG